VGDVRGGIDVGVNATLLPTLDDVVGHDLGPRLNVGLDQGLHLLGPIEHLAKQQPRAVRVLDEEVDRLGCDGLELLMAGGGRLEQARHRLVPVRQHLLEHAAPELVLGGEVVEQGRLADADRLGDVPQRSAHKAAGREQPGGLLQDLLGNVGASGTIGRHVGPTSRSDSAYHSVERPSTDR